VGEPLDTRFVGLSCDAFGGLNVHRMKCVVAALDIKTNRIDHSVGAGNRIGYRSLVVNVSLYRFKLQIVATEQPPIPVWMPRCGSHTKTVCAQMPSDAAA
jgi:hypothetical protein